MNGNIQRHLEDTVYRSVGLPGSFFISSEIFEMEKRHFFCNSWICIGLETDVPENGDVCPVTIFDQPLLITRDKDSGVRVFHNVCSHRGTRLIDKPRRCATITCPYHAWSYSLDGKLLNTPHVGGENINHCKEINKEKLGLVEVRCAVWAGLIFINLSENNPDFEGFISPLSERWKRIDVSLLEHVKDVGQRPEFNANWKLVVENFVESYHLPCVHKSMNTFNPMGAHYQILGGEAYIGQGVKAHNPTDGYAGQFKPFPALLKEEYGTGESMYLPANLIIICMADFFFANIVMPVSPNLTTERIEMFLIGASANEPQLQYERQQLMDILCRVNDEDIGICEEAQKGRASAAFTGGAFALLQETTTLQFQKLLAQKLLAATAPPAEKMPRLPCKDIHHPQ